MPGPARKSNALEPPRPNPPLAPKAWRVTKVLGYEPLPGIRPSIKIYSEEKAQEHMLQEQHEELQRQHSKRAGGGFEVPSRKACQEEVHLLQQQGKAREKQRRVVLDVPQNSKTDGALEWGSRGAQKLVTALEGVSMVSGVLGERSNAPEATALTTAMEEYEVPGCGCHKHTEGLGECASIVPKLDVLRTRKEAGQDLGHASPDLFESSASERARWQQQQHEILRRRLYNPASDAIEPQESPRPQSRAEQISEVVTVSWTDLSQIRRGNRRVETDKRGLSVDHMSRETRSPTGSALQRTQCRPGSAQTNLDPLRDFPPEPEIPPPRECEPQVTLGWRHLSAAHTSVAPVLQALGGVWRWWSLDASDAAQDNERQRGQSGERRTGAVWSRLSRDGGTRQKEAQHSIDRHRGGDDVPQQHGSVTAGEGGEGDGSQNSSRSSGRISMHPGWKAQSGAKTRHLQPALREGDKESDKARDQGGAGAQLLPQNVRDCGQHPSRNACACSALPSLSLRLHENLMV